MTYHSSLILFVLLSCVTFMQSQDLFSDHNKEQFVEVYMGLKASADPVLDLSQFDISADRLGEILGQGLAGHAPTVSAREAQALQAIHDRNAELAMRRVQLERDLCASAGLSHEIYVDIRQRYRSDLQFQREMRPFFQAYFNQRR